LNAACGLESGFGAASPGVRGEQPIVCSRGAWLRSGRQFLCPFRLNRKPYLGVLAGGSSAHRKRRWWLTNRTWMKNLVKP